MHLNSVTEQLESIANAGKDNRARVAEFMVKNSELIPSLIAITFDINNSLSVKAAWVLEWICTHHSITYLLPFLDKFCTHIKHLTHDSAIRPCAKICEQLAVKYDKDITNKSPSLLTPKQINQIVETGFDWLITPQKIAVRAYTMNTLFLFGKKIDWIHPELKQLISTSIIHESKGTESRGKKVLSLIEKHQNSHS